MKYAVMKHMMKLLQKMYSAFEHFLHNGEEREVYDKR